MVSGSRVANVSDAEMHPEVAKRGFEEESMVAGQDGDGGKSPDIDSSAQGVVRWLCPVSKERRLVCQKADGCERKSWSR